MTPKHVLIVGAGPTGLMLAALLSRWGIRPRIIDSNDGPSQYSKATGVQARTLEAFQQLGLANAAVAQGLPATAVNLFNDAGKIAHVPFGNIGQDISPFPYMLILPQDRTEAILGGDVATHGVVVEWKTRLESLAQTADGVQATLSKNGQTETTTFRYIVGADGARSTVRKSLDIAFQGDTFEHRFFVADLRIDNGPAEGELNIFLSNRFKFVAMFPMKGTRRFRLVGIVPDAYAHLPHPTFDDLQPYFTATMGDLMQFSDSHWFATYSVHHLVAEHFKRGDILLAGDAAHVHSPVGGQGMNTGLQDAYNLAWKLALVLRGEAGSGLLETYHNERHPNAVKLVNTTDAVFSGFIASTSGWSGFIRRRVVPLLVPPVVRARRVQRQMFNILSQTALTYRDRSLSVDRLGGKVRAGDRFPWFQLGGQSVYERLSPTRFTLFAIGDWTAQTAALDGLRSELLEVIPIVDQALYAKAGLTEGIFLVRPDGYIGLTSKDVSDVHGYLQYTIGLAVPPTVGTPAA
jgi:2-polyprenyl-6-methoxyphenol hydroxylase-like FAD-dependent oxidoreductase